MSKPLRYLRLRGRLGESGPPFLADLPPGVHRLGSIDDNDIVLRFHGVSRHHLLLRVGEEVTVEDLGSKNGTRVNGRPHKRGPLEVGDEIFIGPVRLHLEVAGADDVRLATRAGGRRPILDADDLELDEEPSEQEELTRLDRVVERLERSGASGGLEALEVVAEALEAGGAAWLVWWEHRRCLVTSSWGVDFHGLLDLEALCSRAEAVAGSRRAVVLRSPGPPALVATVLLGRPHPSALLLWDTPASAALARLLARLLDRECASLEADQPSAGDEPPKAVGWIDGPDPASRLLRVEVARVLGEPLPILIEGEVGTGKRHLARWIHAASGRPGPLVEAECAELSDAALAQGFRVAAEQKGTLLLEQIGDLDESLYEPVLQILDAAKANPRLLMTSRSAGRDGDRLDLPEPFERALRRQVIKLEPLRRRREQIPRLVRHFLGASRDEAQDAEAARRSGAARGITVEAMRRLFEHDWPGNVEELRQRLDDLRRRAAGRAIDATTLPAEWPPPSGGGAHRTSPPSGSRSDASGIDASTPTGEIGPSARAGDA